MIVYLLDFLEEFSFSRGQYVGLCPKTYIAYNADDKSTKSGTKGIPHYINLSLQAFLSQLYEHGDHKVTLTSLRLDNNRKMSKITQIKRGLSDLFCKFHVDDDQITCKPLKYNGNFL